MLLAGKAELFASNVFLSISGLNSVKVISISHVQPLFSLSLLGGFQWS
jgi:hypothetical protein